MLTRILCPCCNVNPVAINYYKYGRTYYRNKCAQCYRKKKKPMPAGWVRSGYKKKEKCEQCNFKFKFDLQSSVHHIDQNTQNNDWFNLRTVCANCSIELSQKNATWVKPKSKLRPDF